MKNTFYRSDHIGSFLRPAKLMDAMRKHAAGAIDDNALHAVEDEAILEVVKMQREAGNRVFTDGEFRRADFRSNFLDSVEGFEHFTTKLPWKSEDAVTELDVHGWYVSGKLTRKRSMTAHEADFMQKHVEEPIKITLPSAGFVASRCFRPGVTDKAYENNEKLTDDLVAITRTELQELIDRGIDYIQLDNPGYAFFLDPKNRARIKAGGGDPDKEFAKVLAADVASLQGLNKTDDVKIGMHICRGNYKSYWLAEGGYDAIAEKLFSELPVDRFLLEYDSERAGGFEPLRFVPDGKIAVLGLVSTKISRVEDRDEILGRFDEAAKIMSEDSLAISPQCGFASVAEAGNDLSVDDQRRKLELVNDVATMLWGFNM